MNQSFREIVEQLQQIVQEMLTEQKVNIFIGYGQGTQVARTTPLFISEPVAAKELTWSPFCVNNLVTYLLDYRDTTEKIGLLVKGCDSRSIIRLLQDNQITRERIYVTGVPCQGLLDSHKVMREIDPYAKLSDVQDGGDHFLVITNKRQYRFSKKEYLLPKCLECTDPNPVLSDIFVGNRIDNQIPYKKRYEEVKALEKLSPPEKSSFWDSHFRSCLRCYACRNVCPACNCRECIFDQTGPDWISKRNNLSENTAFHIIRALHVAGRCVDCGECERVCPVNIPLRHLNQKVLKDIEELYDAPLPGTDMEQKPALGHFSVDDPDEFK